MIFLINYNRQKSMLESITEFSDEHRKMAEEARLMMEIKNLECGTAREIVLLEALTKDNLRHTHRRYFETLSELTSDSRIVFTDVA
ncbi:hypothetical protein [Acidiferrobacter sp.]|uniref:hypothetical protein n=1 Tax=Acidiferrobacter sp. TaxID=1872107 RepID=UPI00261A4052|nr:hypothetical protein [Acidiferrobacter sp.]